MKTLRRRKEGGQVGRRESETGRGERGCVVLDQPQRVGPASAPRLVFDTAALPAHRPRQTPRRPRPHSRFPAFPLSRLLPALLAVTHILQSTSPLRAAEFFLRAAPITNTMPDGVEVIQWGFARDSSFGALDGTVTVPGPVLIVPPADNVLTIRLDNDLPEAISIVINGQFPTNAPAPVLIGGRVRSFTHETPPGNAAPVTYTWSNVRPGTFLYLSGSHPQVQVPMGLYGAMKKDMNNGVAYPGVSYASDVVLLYSEIDPVLNNAVGTDDFGPGKSITSTVDYQARYFLINGTPFASGLPPIPAGDPGKTNLLRFLNASSEAHIPILDGFYLRQIAEDGNQYPFPRNQYSVYLPPQKTLDALILAPPAGTNALYDRRLGLVNGTNSPGGMLAYLSFSFTPPQITSQPANQIVGEGATATFNVSASGSTPLSYRWQRNDVNLANGGNISGATSSTLTLTNLLSAQAGTYSVVVSNVLGTLPSSDVILSILTRAEAVDAPGLTWTSGGASPWLAQTGVTHDGVDAAQSGAIPHNGESWLETTVTGPGTLSFWWKDSSEPSNDRLRLYVNGSEVLRISGEVNWQFQTVNLASGTQTLRWRYNKNSSITSGQDRAWLDQVQFAGPIVALNSIWKYLDNGTDQGTAWRAPLFVDSSWSSGPAELGYGDGGEATVVGFGPNSNNRYITTYFRHSFTVANPAAYSSLLVSLLRDDGAVVYLNGVEVFRSNMPAGAINYLTLASGSGNETTFYSATVPAANLVMGANVLAVEVHQASAGSGDISFNLQLTGTPAP